MKLKKKKSIENQLSKISVSLENYKTPIQYKCISKSI